MKKFHYYLFPCLCLTLTLSFLALPLHGPTHYTVSAHEPRGNRKPSSKKEIELKDWYALTKDLHSKRWPIRCFGALQAKRYPEFKVQALLYTRCQVETESAVQSFYLLAMAQGDRDALTILVNPAFVEQQVNTLLKTDIELQGDAITAFLNRLFNTNYPNHPPSWAKAWKSKKRSFEKRWKKAVEKFEKQQGTTLADHLAKLLKTSSDHDDSSFVPNKLQEYLGRIEEEGIDMAIILDDTGSMEPSITAAKKGITTLMKAMKLLSPKFRVGLVTYKDEINKHVELTSDIAAMQTVVDKLSADGGDDFPEAIALGIWYARDNFKWRDKSVKMFVVIGDAPFHKQRKKELLDSLKALATDGYTLHAVSVADQLVEGFQDMATAGNGVAVQMGTDQAKLMTTLLNLIFGVEYKDYTEEFTAILFRYFEIVKKKH